MAASNQSVQTPKVLYYDSEDILVADMENRGEFSIKNGCLVVKLENTDNYYQPIFRPSVKLSKDSEGEFVLKLPKSTLPLNETLKFSGAETQSKDRLAETALKNLACNLPLYSIGDISL